MRLLENCAIRHVVGRKLLMPLEAKVVSTAGTTCDGAGSAFAVACVALVGVMVSERS